MTRVWPDHAWLVLAAPVHARAFRVRDSRLRETLAACGATVTDDGADVEIADASRVVGDTACAITTLSVPPADRGPLPVRRGVRLARSSALRLAAARATRALRSKGYDHVTAIPWEDEGVFAPWLPGWSGRRSLADRLPADLVLLAGSGSRPAPTVLEACLDAARGDRDVPLDVSRVLIRDTLAAAITGAGVVRTGLGPGAVAIDAQIGALAQLETLAAPASVTSAVPRVAASGSTGLATWSLETRLSGSTVAGRPDDAVMRDALDFLVAVHALDLRAAPAPPDLQAWCDVVLSTSPAQTGAVRAVSTRAAERLTGFPTVFGHGDFFGGNLLVEDGRLTGVLDWERAGPGHLALVDLLQLEICAELRAARPFFGDAIVDAALPTARSGGDELVRAYCNRLGIEVGAETLVALLAACWLSWVAFEAGRLADRAADREWVHRNVDQVAAALADATSSGA